MGNKSKIESQTKEVLEEDPEIYLQKARESMEFGDVRNALFEIDSAVFFSNRGSKYLFEKAKMLFAIGKYTDYVELLESNLEKFKTDIGRKNYKLAMNYLGKAYFLSGEYYKGIIFVLTGNKGSNFRVMALIITFALLIIGSVTYIGLSNGGMEEKTNTASVDNTYQEYVSRLNLSSDKENIIINEKTKLNLEITMSPEESIAPEATYTSSDTKVATVDKEGIVTGIAPGTTTIKAEAGGKEAEITINVSASEFKEFKILLDKLTIDVGESIKARVKVNLIQPDGDKPSIAYSSNDTSVATVDEDGIIKGVSEGKAVITAKSGDTTSEITITVGAQVTDMKIQLGTTTLQVGGRTKAKVNLVMKPTDAKRPNITFLSSANNVAEVYADGTIKGKGAGTAVITATAGEKTSKVTIKVLEEKPRVVSFRFSINKSTIAVGEQAKASVNITMSPYGAETPGVSYFSSDSGVATISKNGTIKGIGPGTAIITAEVNGKSKEIYIEISE